MNQELLNNLNVREKEFYFDFSLLENHSFLELVAWYTLGVQAVLLCLQDVVKVKCPKAEMVRVYV